MIEFGVPVWFTRNERLNAGVTICSRYEETS